MTTTPPPPARIHTPPTPLHGSKYDNYEPYSPRRSSRVAAQRKNIAIEAPKTSLSSQKIRRTRAVTPTTALSTRTSSHTFSPPYSPASPALNTPRKGKGRAGFASRHFDNHADLGLSSGGEHSHELDPFQANSLGMLPTPAKTPRKRAVEQSSISSAARVLFPGRTATVEEAMPDPKKARRSKKSAFSLDSFEAMHEEGESSTIPIYTDSKERVPDYDENEDNPFVTRRGRPARSTRKKWKDEKSAHMDQAMRNEEGVIVTFRGKKIFRRFDDAEPGTEEDTWSDVEIRRKAGSPGRERPFLRSSYKPRLLFPTEEQRREREAAANEADEEALTDIEVPGPQSSARNRTSHFADIAATPAKNRIRALTPPSTARKTRGTARKLFDSMTPSITVDSPKPAGHESDDQASVTSSLSKKSSPFDTWRRVKAGASRAAATSKKREGEPLDAVASASKRAKNTTS